MTDQSREKRTLLVIILTLITMFIEIVIGYITHSMALFADGWHMGTHAFALSITFITYVLIRKLKFYLMFHLYLTLSNNQQNPLYDPKKNYLAKTKNFPRLKILFL